MIQQKLRSLFGASALVGVVALAAVTAASPYAGPVFIDAGNAGGGTTAASAAWSDLMSMLEDCATGHGCAVTVASGDQTFHWTSEGPVLALADGAAVVCEAADAAVAPGGTHVADVTTHPGAHKLTP